MGRPLLLDPDTHERIVTAVRAGMYVHDAAARCGIGERTLYRWLERGRAAFEAEQEADDAGAPDEDPEGPPDPEFEYRQLWQAVMVARSDARLEAVATIRMEMVGRPAQYDEQGNVVREELPPGRDKLRAALEFLARTDPKNWGRTNRPVEDDSEQEVDPETLRARAEDLIDAAVQKAEWHAEEGNGTSPAP